MMIKPPRLRPGDTVAVVAPGGAVLDRSALDRGISTLEGLGYRVRLGTSVSARDGYLAGSETLRRDDLVQMFSAPDVRAIFCARGGYGVTRLLPSIDPRALAGKPKILVGYSDVTPLLVALVQVGDLVTFHGPMVAPDLAGRRTQRAGVDPSQSFDDAFDEESKHQLTAVLGGSAEWEITIPKVVRPGVARGMLIGGCLSLLAATAGTRHALRGEGTILFIEDVAEPAYRIDRMLTQLDQAGIFAGVRAIVFGAMLDCGAGPGDHRGTDGLIEALANRLGVPVGSGLPSGHGRPNLMLPFGVCAEVVLEAGRGILRVKEAAVV